MSLKTLYVYTGTGTGTGTYPVYCFYFIFFIPRKKVSNKGYILYSLPIPKQFAWKYKNYKKNLSQSRTEVIALAPAKYPGSETLVSGAGPLM